MNDNIEEISNTFFNSFQSSHVLLYIGQNVNDDDVKKYISQGRWSAIITTNHDPEFSSYFATNGRNLQTCTTRQQFSNRFLSREKPLFIQLLGVDGEPFENEDHMLQSPFGTNSRNMRSAVRLLDSLPSLLDYVNSLVITGIDSDEDIKLLGQLGEVLINEVTPGSVSFWGMGDAFTGKEDIKAWFKSICEKQSFRFYDTTLAEIFQYRAKEEQAFLEEPPSPDINGDIFFCNQKPVNVSKDELLRINNVGTLLTERTINRIRPMGHSQKRMWFSNFLELSGVGEPQWYGYAAQSNFHVKREYEDALVQLIRKVLNGQTINGELADEYPIVLAGDPGSSKSVTLGALAYRIYCEKIHPVVFVSGEVFLGNSSGSGFRNLIDSLEAIQSLSGSASSILVVWDGSSYCEIESDAKKLLTQLRNRGRKVVLVCSSYSLRENESASSCYMYNDNGAFDSCSTPDDADIVARAGCLFVKATRIMNEREQDSFWRKAVNYSGISTEQIEFLKKRMAEESSADIFNYYYHLVSMLRERLENSLEGEQDKVARFLQEERPDCLKVIAEQRRTEQESNAMWQAFLKAGVPREMLLELNGNTETDEADEEWKDRLVRANAYIALFSKFKIDIPYSFVYAIITNKSDENPYSESGRELFDVLTTNIPWLSCGENDDEEFVFRFRNSLEADIFLGRHGIEGERLVEMAVETLRLYGESYQRNQYDNPRLAQKLQSLIRLIGPNSRYYGKYSPEHKAILAHLEIIIDAIDELLNEYRVPDEDCGFAMLFVTLTREYYGRNLWEVLHGQGDKQTVDYCAEGFTPVDYENRLSKESKASLLAQSCARKLEDTIATNKRYKGNDYLRRQASGFAVESARCELECDDLFVEFSNCCDLTGWTPNESSIDYQPSYPTHYQNLAAAIRYEPVNGYAYNALFSLFEREYQSDGVSAEQKIEHLTEVMTFVDACLTYGDEIGNRGVHRDELREHISRIGSLADNIPASIDTIENGEESLDARDASTFISIYNKLLAKNKPAAILFVCQKEIAQFRSRDNLSEAEMRRCQRVVDFMTEPKRYACVCEDANALAFLIRTAWMAFNGTSLNEMKGCQTTALSLNQWRDLHRYCWKYSQVVPPCSQQPMLILVYALSALQIGGRDHESYLSANSIIRQIDEGQFNSQYRMRTPFIVCEEDGTPLRYTGTVIHVGERTGYMRVSGLPESFGTTRGVHFHQLNMGRNSQMPDDGEVIPDLELGIGYRGFSLYTEQGRKDLGRHQR